MNRRRGPEVAVQIASTSAVALLAFCTIVPKAVAKPRHTKAADPLVAIVAHLPLQEGPARQMFVLEHNRKQYLYIEQVPKGGFAVVDVTDPAHPNIIKKVAWPKDAPAGELQLVGSNLLLFTAQEQSSGAAPALNLPTAFVGLLDLSDPANPRRLYGFTGVTSILAEDGRNLIYITNSEGLWILRQRQKQEQPAEPSEVCPGIGGCA